MLVLLLPVAFLLLWFLLHDHRSVIGFGRLSIRGTFVLAYLAFEAILLLVTEITSIGHHLTPTGVTIAWGLVAAALLAASWRPARALREQHGFDRIPERVRARLVRLGIADRVWLGVLLIVMVILVIVGLMYLPSNVDAMTYHLARVAHWIQDRSVADFATHFLAQIEYPPLAEYNLAVVQLLAGTVRLDGLVDLLATIVCVVGVTELARLLGASRSVQILAAVIAATIPTAVLLATSTENNPVTAAMGIGLLLVLLTLTLDRHWLGQGVALGAALALAYVTKTTVLIELFPTVIVVLGVKLYRLLRSVDLKLALVRFAAFGATAVATGIALAVPFVNQNLVLFNSPVGPTTDAATSSHLTLNVGLANVIRSTANNFHIGDGRSGFTATVEKLTLHGMNHVYNLLHVSQSDSRYAVNPAFHAFAVLDYSGTVRSEDGGANPWTVVLILLSLVVLVVAALRGGRSSKERGPLRLAAVLAVTLTAGYLLFTFVDKWGPFDARYVLPLMSAWSALIAIALSRFGRWISWVVVALLVVACLPELVNSQARPLEQPSTYASSYLEPYFIACCSNASSMAASYETVAADLSQSSCHHAALTDWVQYEYPLWPALSHERWNGVLDDTNVTNQSRRLESKAPHCAWISQMPGGYRTPDGRVNLLTPPLALSVTPSAAVDMRTPTPHFTSSVSGVDVWPGGGWVPYIFPLLAARSGSLYLTNRRASSVPVELRLDTGAHSPPVELTGPDGGALPSTVSDGTVRAELSLPPGVTRIGIGLGDHASTRPLLPLRDVSVTGVDSTQVTAAYASAGGASAPAVGGLVVSGRLSRSR